MDVSQINTKLRQPFSASSSTSKLGEVVTLFPSAKDDSQVIGTFDRLATNAQRFEVVSQNGETFVRPWLPPTSDIAIGSFGWSDSQDEQLLRAA